MCDEGSSAAAAVLDPQPPALLKLQPLSKLVQGKKRGRPRRKPAPAPPRSFRMYPLSDRGGGVRTRSGGDNGGAEDGAVTKRVLRIAPKVAAVDSPDAVYYPTLEAAAAIDETDGIAAPAADEDDLDIDIKCEPDIETVWESSLERKAATEDSFLWKKYQKHV